MQSERLLKYIKQGVDQLLAQERFDGDQTFRKTQREALEAYKKYLNQHGLTPEEKLKGFFEIPTGAGKTAVFIGIISAAHRVAEQNGEALKTAIVVPTQQLMYQTLEAIQGNDKNPDDPEYIKGFAPHLKDQIGLYGDAHKNLKFPITVMTYDAWYDLSQSGEIGSHNIDILISDEAHRGTSERRIENIKGVFNAQTAQIAFTATAHFDRTKSVQASHERQIFYKSIAEAMKDDELADYIESQRAVIRVEPDIFMLSDEFKEATKEERIAYRKKLRLAAWNRFAVKAYRDGADTRRDQPLSDNQAGFFVEGINQANDLESMLNADLELQRKAGEQGRKGVAVAIHSGLSPSEQRRRFEAYKKGEYMAVVGDEKFKEGFDHPPMKTIIDCPHKSLVDKAQIIGRGARKWWNTLKHHFEGMTIIDTVMYFGSPDEERAALHRERALRKAILTKNILGESYVLGPGVPAKQKSEGSAGGGPRIFDGDLDVEYYATIDEIHSFDGELRSLLAKNKLTMALIKQTIDAYRAAHGGKNPTANLGAITEGPLAGKATWDGLTKALRLGGTGLSEDPEWQKLNAELGNGKVTLANLITKLGYRDKLTMALIKETIDAYRKKHGGKNLSTESGAITEGPLAGRIEWGGLDLALRNGSNGLSEDPEWQKLKAELGSGKVTLRALLTYLGYKKAPLRLTIALIKETIDAYRAANGGEIQP